MGPATSYLPFMRNSSLYNPIYIDSSSSVGIRVIDSYIDIGAGSEVVIENNTSHGIDVFNATFVMNAAPSGSGNGGAGCYAHDNSVVRFPTGTTPTVTGTVGDTTTDGTNPNNTWATINGGTRVTDTDEFTIIKAV